MKGEANRKEHKTPACEDLLKLVNDAVDSTETPDAELGKERAAAGGTNCRDSTDQTCVGGGDIS